MVTGSADIPWQTLRQIVREWAGSSVDLAEVKPLDGGQINTTLLLVLSDGTRTVIKISPHRVDRNYADEAYQLGLLRSLELPVPDIHQVFLGSLEQPYSYLMMEFVDGMDLRRARRHCSDDEFTQLQNHLAEMVNRLHQRTHHAYQRVSRRDDRQFDSWCDFYRAVYDIILSEAEKTALLPKKVYKQIGRIHDQLERIVAHDDQPRLIHGDLWSTNVLARPNGKGAWQVTAILDPNCKYAHAESELAYLELFDTVTPGFMKAYQCDRKLDPEYHRLRKHVYQLYPLIDHLQMFGPDYTDAVKKAVEKVSALV